MPALGDMGNRATQVTALLPDRYEIVRERARGGMATVYLAVDRKLDRRVAIKVLASEFAAGIGAERFLHEIAVAAHLNHPHVLPLLDSGLAGECPYYVMPFVAGESLQELLEREGQLPVQQALTVALDVGQALTCAHEHGLVHRDVKPANILLTEGGPVVSDFGIAIAMDRAAEDRLTRTGQSVGTIGYMSPEQAGGDEDLDGRTDQYSLACVLFEMLAGEPPYVGKTARAILAKQLTQPVPRVSVFRDPVPDGLDAALARALARAPADRFATVREFTEVLDDLVRRPASGAPEPAAARALPTRHAGLIRSALAPSTRSRSTLTRSARWSIPVIAVLLAALGWLLWSLARPGAPVAAVGQADSSRYAIFPFRGEARGIEELNETQRLRDALARWGGISIVDPFQVREAMDRAGDRPLTPEAAARIALAQGAGRYFMGEVSAVGDGLRIHAGLYDVGGTLLVDRALRLTASAVSVDSAASVDSVFASLADYLLFLGSPPEEPPALLGTRSLPARQAFDRGSAAIRAWKLERADSAFSHAVDLDPGFGRAHLWVALSRAWNGQDRATWRIPAEQAALHMAGLTARDSAMVDAIVAQARGETGRACEQWGRITDSQPRDFAPWYGLAICLARDRAVVPDPVSPSGWIFRSSRHQALLAYQKAFRLLPSILGSFRSNAFGPLRSLFSLSSNVVQSGHAMPPDTTRFIAYAAWQDDTLAYLPLPGAPTLVAEGRASRILEGQEVAVAHLRGVFVDVARQWAVAAPASAAAREALAVGLGMLGDPSALDTIRRARMMRPATPSARVQMAGTEVWLRLAYALPDDLDGLRRARLLADSLLDGSLGTLPDPALGAALAALTGRANLAASYARRLPATPLSPLPPTVQADGHALLLFAALGGPTDSLRRLERVVSAGIERLVEPANRQEALAFWLVRPATLGFPEYRFEEADALSFDWLVAAQADFLERDTSAVRERLRAMAEGRRGMSPTGLAIDALYPEARLLFLMGDEARAAAWLDPTLHALPGMDPAVLATPERMAALIRACALRALIGAKLGDTVTARRWARAALLLWSDADPVLKPGLIRLQRIAR